MFEEQTREALTVSKDPLANRWKHLFSILPCGIVVLDGSGTVSDANSVARDLLGEPLLRRRWIDVIDRVIAPRFDDGHEVSLKDGKRVSISTRSLSPEPGQLIVINDLSETRALQTRLHRQQNLSEIGRMMAQVAHQIRTPVATAMLYASHLESESLADDKRQKFAEKIGNCLKNLDQQMRDMLLFARGGHTILESVQMDDLLKQVETVTEAAIQKHQAKLIMHNRAGNFETYGNQESLVGAIQNLINNALEASKGQIEIELLIQRDEQAGRYELIVMDNGCGMDDETREHMLDPFFTTKTCGTGLGMAVVNAVAKAHGGELWIESIANEGSTIGLRLPILSKPINKRD